MKRVIDGDNMVLLEEWDEEEVTRNEMIEKYDKDPKWGDVGEDFEGDIIVYRE